MSTYYYMYPTSKIEKKKNMHACEAAAGAKLAHFPQPTTGTSFGNFIYTTIGIGIGIG